MFKNCKTKCLNWSFVSRVLVKTYIRWNCNSMYVAFLWILAERVKKHDLVLHISRSLFLHHILVMFYFYTNLRESGLGNMSLRTHIRGSFSKVSKYLLSLLWAKRCTRHSGHSKRSLPPNFVFFFFFKKET